MLAHTSELSTWELEAGGIAQSSLASTECNPAWIPSISKTVQRVGGKEL